MSGVRGQVRLTPAAVMDVEATLTPYASHIWLPFAPAASIEVDHSHRWYGHGCLDANFAAAALKADFRRWTWGRYPRALAAPTSFYDGIRADGSALALDLDIANDCQAQEIAPPPLTAFGPTS